MLTISVKNFGPIAEGSVDLKPLTIFVGPSNTGKSYMATAVYSVMKGFEGPYDWGYNVGYTKQPEGERPIQWFAPSGRKLTARNEGKDAVAALVQWGTQLSGDTLDPREVRWADLSTELRTEMEHSTGLMLDSLIQDVIDKLVDTYGEEPSFVNEHAEEQNFSLDVKRREPLLNLRVRLTEGAKRPHEYDLSRTPIGQPYLGAMLRREEANDRPYVSHTANATLFLTFLDSAIEPIFADFPSHTFYLPAARSGMVIGHKPLSSSLIRNSIQMRTRVRTHSVLPATATDFLSQLVSLDRRMAAGQGDKDTARAIDFIESRVLQGQVEIDESAGLPLPDIVYLPSTGVQPTGKFTLNQTSSMVSELAPLVLFLKYLVRPGDLLILEEPESHLHPAAQLQMARGIARLVNAGVQVLITTHSSDFIDQINNLISMSNVSEETWAELGLEQEDCLQPEQVSAYGFRIDSEKGGAVTYPLPVGSDVGIEDEEFLPVTELLYEQAISLQRNRLT